MARERAWLLRGEAGRPIPTVRCGGVAVPGLVIDFDASLVTCHSEKEGAASTFKHGFGYHPLLVWLDNTNEALAGMLRPGNAGSNTAADHIRLTDEAFAQIPDAERHGQPILVRCDGAGATKEWLTHLRRLPRRAGSGRVGSRSGSPSPTRSRTRSRCCPSRCGRVAVDAAGETPPGRRVRAAGRPGRRADRCCCPDSPRRAGRTGCGSWSAGNGPTPAPQISVFEAHDGWRYQCVATDTGRGQLAFLEARHRAHARVEDRVKAIKQTGMGRFPSREFTINQVWLQLALTAADLIAWTQTILLDGALAAAEPKKLRYQLLHTAARIVHGQPHRIKIDTSWPWATQLAAAFTRLAEIRPPLLV